MKIAIEKIPDAENARFPWVVKEEDAYGIQSRLGRMYIGDFGVLVFQPFENAVPDNEWVVDYLIAIGQAMKEKVATDPEMKAVRDRLIKSYAPIAKRFGRDDMVKQYGDEIANLYKYEGEKSIIWQDL